MFYSFIAFIYEILILKKAYQKKTQYNYNEKIVIK